MRWQARNYAVADSRARGVCEGCGASGSRLEHHHIAGRSDQEPWVSVAELIAVLCVPCHKAVTGVIGGGINARLQMELSDAAKERLHQNYGIQPGSLLEMLKKLKRTFDYSAESNRLIRK